MKEKERNMERKTTEKETMGKKERKKVGGK